MVIYLYLSFQKEGKIIAINNLRKLYDIDVRCSHIHTSGTVSQLVLALFCPLKEKNEIGSCNARPDNYGLYMIHE